MSIDNKLLKQNKGVKMPRSKIAKKKPKLTKPLKFWQQQIDKYWFSRYIKLKYHKNGYCQCVTCGRWCRLLDMDAGHYIGREYKPRYDLKNVHPQCKVCNNWKKGNPLPYQDYIIEKYGENKNKQLRGYLENNIRYKRHKSMRKFAIWLQEQCELMNYTEFWKEEKSLKDIK